MQYLFKAAGGTCRATMFCDLAALTTFTVVYGFVLVTLDKWDFIGCNIEIKFTLTGLKSVLPAAAVKDASACGRSADLLILCLQAHLCK